jgi:ParB/RepB/Spo0J family partition protein
MQTVKIDLDKIEQNENSRVIYKEQDLAELMGSLKKHGLLQPIGVRKIAGGKFDAIFGNRRILAAKKLGWASIAANVIESDTETERDILGLVENIKRKNTTLAEDGRMFIVLKDRGLSNAEIAARVEISADRIQFAIDCFNELPKDMHSRIVHTMPGVRRKNGRISATSAIEVLKIKKTHNLNRKQTRALLNYSASNNASSEHMKLLAPMLSAGKTIPQAIKLMESHKMIELRVFVESSDLEKIEKKENKSINLILSEYLEKFPRARVTRRPREVKRVILRHTAESR